MTGLICLATNAIVLLVVFVFTVANSEDLKSLVTGKLQESRILCLAISCRLNQCCGSNGCDNVQNFDVQIDDSSQCRGDYTGSPCAEKGIEIYGIAESNSNIECVTSYQVKYFLLKLACFKLINYCFFP